VDAITGSLSQLRVFKANGRTPLSILTTKSITTAVTIRISFGRFSRVFGCRDIRMGTSGIPIIPNDFTIDKPFSVFRADYSGLDLSGRWLSAVNRFFQRANDLPG
jgi:hypothetical protein